MAGYIKASEGEVLRTKEDQDLWDRVAIACYAENVQVARDKAGAALCAFDDADVFMKERAKRLNLEK